MGKVIVVVGPNASGKSGIAIKLAKKFNGEIISADSRQVYRGMDLGSGKVEGKKQNGVFASEGIKHHLIDVASPQDHFGIHEWLGLTRKALAGISKRKKTPIVCGGTGFWTESLIRNLAFPEVEPDWQLRKKLGQLTALELYQRLRELDRKRAGEIGKTNKNRLIRAIEICQSLGKVPALKKRKEKDDYQYFQIGVSWPREELYKRIKIRLDQRFEQGMVKEVERIHKKGVSWQRLESFGLEYGWIAKYLQGKISLSEMKQKLFQEIKKYAKRQIAWFKRDKSIKWSRDYRQIERWAEKFLSCLD